jgi:hypothetical protein
MLVENPITPPSPHLTSPHLTSVPSRTLDLHFVKEIKGRNFVMIKRNKNIKLKKKGAQQATYCPVKGTVYIIQAAS